MGAMTGFAVRVGFRLRVPTPVAGAPERVESAADRGQRALKALDALETGRRGGPEPANVTLAAHRRAIPES